MEVGRTGTSPGHSYFAQPTLCRSLFLRPNQAPKKDRGERHSAFAATSRTVAHVDPRHPSRIYLLAGIRSKLATLERKRANLRSGTSPMPATRRSGAVAGTGGLRALRGTNDSLL